MIDDKSISLSFFYGSKVDHQDVMLIIHIVPTIRTPAKKRRHRETHVCLCTSAFSSGHQSFPDFLTQVKFFTLWPNLAMEDYNFNCVSGSPTLKCSKKIIASFNFTERVFEVDNCTVFALAPQNLWTVSGFNPHEKWRAGLIPVVNPNKWRKHGFPWYALCSSWYSHHFHPRRHWFRHFFVWTGEKVHEYRRWIRSLDSLKKHEQFPYSLNVWKIYLHLL